MNQKQEMVKYKFMQELTALLVKWDAYIEDNDGYIEISVLPVYIRGEMIRPGVDINLGKWFCPELQGDKP